MNKLWYIKERQFNKSGIAGGVGCCIIVWTTQINYCHTFTICFFEECHTFTMLI